jgi:hypothetical protein
MVVGLNMDETVWVPTVFTQNRTDFWKVTSPRSSSHTCWLRRGSQTCSRTSTSAWMEPSSKPGRVRRVFSGNRPAVPPDDPGNPTVDFHGEKRSNETHQSSTDPDARLARKSGGHESKLAYCGNVLIENRNGIVVDTALLQCSGMAERHAAMIMTERVEGVERITLGADKGYDTKEFVKEMRGMNVTPHVSQNIKRQGGSAIDGRTTRHDGYQVSQRKRKRIEEVFGLGQGGWHAA